jgi:hypothetical protein
LKQSGSTSSISWLTYPTDVTTNTSLGAAVIEKVPCASLVVWAFPPFTETVAPSTAVPRVLLIIFPEILSAHSFEACKAGMAKKHNSGKKQQ